MRPLSETGQQLVDDLLDDIRRNPRYQGSVHVDDDGRGHYRGAAHLDRAGGLFATQADIRRLRANLRRAGMTLQVAEVDAIVSEAIYRSDAGEAWYLLEGYTMPHPKIYDTPEEQIRQKRNRRRERLREAGLCVICGKESVAPNRATCNTCVQRDRERRKSRRED